MAHSNDDFHEIRLSVNYSFGTRWAPGFGTGVFVRDSGVNSRLSKKLQATRRYEALYSVQSPADCHYLLSFYLCRNGPAHGFRFKDLKDFTSAPNGTDDPTPTDSVIYPVGNSAVTYQLSKTYGSNGLAGIRPITKPWGGVKIAIDGVEQTSGFSVDTTTGLVVFDSPPGGVVTAGFMFDVPVRFSPESELSMSYTDFETGYVKLYLEEIAAQELHEDYDIFKDDSGVL